MVFATVFLSPLVAPRKKFNYLTAGPSTSLLMRRSFSRVYNASSSRNRGGLNDKNAICRRERPSRREGGPGSSAVERDFPRLSDTIVATLHFKTDAILLSINSFARAHDRFTLKKEEKKKREKKNTLQRREDHASVITKNHAEASARFAPFTPTQ